MTDTKTCPCGSNQSYGACCGLFISGMAAAPTPEALMRSRYAAYSIANIDYIARTMAGPAAVGFDAAEAKRWAQAIQWVKLEVIASSMEGDKGEVKFKAHYMHNNRSQILAEHSLFEKINGVWMYTDCKPLNYRDK